MTRITNIVENRYRATAHAGQARSSNHNVTLMMLAKTMIVCLVLLTLPCIAAADSADKLAEMSNKIHEETRRLAKIGEIKARFMDNKRIKGRYIRVRFDGEKLQLAGFVPTTNDIPVIERIGSEAVKDKEVESFWHATDGLIDTDAYQTFVGERSSDFALWMKVKAALCSPNVTPLLKTTDVQAVDVRDGHVKVYLIADAPADLDLTPHIKNIKGVERVEVFTLNAFLQSD